LETLLEIALHQKASKGAMALCPFPLPLNPFLGPPAYLRAQALLGKPPTVTTPLPLSPSLSGEPQANLVCRIEPLCNIGTTTVVPPVRCVTFLLFGHECPCFGQQYPQFGLIYLGMILMTGAFLGRKFAKSAVIFFVFVEGDI